MAGDVNVTVGAAPGGGVDFYGFIKMYPPPMATATRTITIAIAIITVLFIAGFFGLLASIDDGYASSQYTVISTSLTIC